MTGADRNPTSLQTADGSTIDVDAWRKAIRNETLAGYHFEMARAIRKEGNAQAALDALGRATAILPDMPEAVFERIEILRNAGRAPEAEAELQQALSRDPAFLAEAHDRRGERLLDQGHEDEALACFERSLALRPGHPATLMRLGLAFLGLKRHDDALAAFRAAVATDRSLVHELAQPYVRLSSWLHSQSREEEALPLLQMSADLAPSNIRILEKLGHVLSDLGEIEQAEQTLHRILHEEPKNIAALNVFGQTLCFKDALDEAAECYLCALDALNDFPPSLYGLSLVRQAQGRFDDALALTLRAAKVLPQDPRAHSYRGQTLQAMGRLEESLEAHKLALSLGSQPPLTRALYAFLLQGIGRSEEALDIFLDVEADPVIGRARLVWLNTGKGLTLNALGRHDEAMNEYRTAIAKAPHAIIFNMRQRPWTIPVLAPAFRELGFQTPWNR